MMREHQEKVPFDFIVNKFAEIKPESISRKLDIPYNSNNNTFALYLMGKLYTVNYPTGEVYDNNGETVKSYVVKTILLRYLVNGNGVPLTNKYISYKDIQDGQIYYTNFYKRTILRLAKIYGEKSEIFLKNLGTLNVEIMEKGDLSFAFEFMKNISFKFVLYKADDEFETTANILMDQNTEDYFNAEDLAVVVDVAIDYFIHGKIHNELGMYNMY
ncbi:DUF3786 domain-containing protein [Alkalibaculum sp. M08DMB]|uniref:DUF3786 domain-containing protein n=1 Tax=Alkalibaculum sporogenes TaxID=2655001 RepID=A0A6A7KC79_9FIRM|nr:DUF3786 domain-containing protein [Alkalibaculum sporogenes]MPW26787.1 DUF3786 domain-containing protein [Alkalibaculum sporogenes]